MPAKTILACLLLFLLLPAHAEQRADTGLVPEVANPSFAKGTGPRVAIDAAHHNFHTLEGRFAPFAALVEADGYRVSSNSQPFSAESLREIDILVIANALHASAAANWAAAPKSAFSDSEIEALSRWVRGGGALLFIADHQPFPAAAAALAREFGFLFYNGYVLNPSLEANQGWITFTHAAGTLHPHPIVSARGATIDSVTLFMGQAFLAPPAARPLLELDRSHYLFLPGPDRKIGNGTPRITVERWLQGATLEWGAGRLAVFAEAGGFTAQNSRRGKFGFNHPRGANNDEFLLNTLHWLHARER